MQNKRLLITFDTKNHRDPVRVTCGQAELEKCTLAYIDGEGGIRAFPLG